MDDRISDLLGIVAALLTSRSKEARSQATEWVNAAASPPGLETAGAAVKAAVARLPGSAGEQLTLVQLLVLRGPQSREP